MINLKANYPLPDQNMMMSDNLKAPQAKFPDPTTLNRGDRGDSDRVAGPSHRER